jgi:hypothetical protein
VPLKDWVVNIMKVSQMEIQTSAVLDCWKHQSITDFNTNTMKLPSFLSGKTMRGLHALSRHVDDIERARTLVSKRFQARQSAIRSHRLVRSMERHVTILDLQQAIVGHISSLEVSGEQSTSSCGKRS